jgi:hypothetical protein
MLGKRYLLHAGACSMALLLLSTSAWAELTGTIYRVPGNLGDATIGVPSPGNEIGTICAVTGCTDITDLNFNVPAGTGTLDDFLNSAGASVNYVLNNAIVGGQVMSDPGSCPACYSTEIEFTGTANLVMGTQYNFSHDDGVVVQVGGSTVINSASPTVDRSDSFTYTGSSGPVSIAIGYMATNGNPEVLQVTAPEPGSVSVLLTMLAAVAGFAGILKKKLA